METNEAEIVAAVQDYWEGWFTGDDTRMRRALHPELMKSGVNIDADGRPRIVTMTAEQMLGWTRDGEGVAERTPDYHPEVAVDDHHDRIATVTVRSGVYREYLHLVKTADGWKILGALYMRVQDERPH
jgi:hypothetical protein